jgi:tRNA(Ile2) C34 agmatinyltransferase TiaS
MSKLTHSTSWGMEAVERAAVARGDKDEGPCPGCGDGDKVPAKGDWRCPVCDAEWHDEDEDTQESA